MAGENLATKYRPKTFDSVVSQEIIVTILQEQIKSGTFKQVYLFCGPAGCGKTTVARIMAKEINKGLSSPIEIDAASNNGVENVRNIIEESYKKPIVGEYKVYILDEVHMLSNGAWNALLKLLEEPPKTVVFILCTTDPQKIPNTILSRVQRFDFTRVPIKDILDRLKFIASSEGMEIKDSVLSYIARMAHGGLRNAVSMLDKISYLENFNDLKEVSRALSYISYEDMIELETDLINGYNESAINVIENWYYKGIDIKQAMSEFYVFVLEVCKGILFNDIEKSNIPSIYDLDVYENNYYDVVKLLDWCRKLVYNLKYESNVLPLVEAEVLLYERGSR